MVVNQIYVDEMNALYERAIMEIGKKFIAFYTGRDMGFMALYNDASVCFNVGRAIRSYDYDLGLVTDDNLIKYREILGSMLIKYTKPILYTHVLNEYSEPVPVATPVIYAGTSPGGLILRSIDLGLTFEVYETSLYGNPTKLMIHSSIHPYFLDTNNIIYCTDTGYVYNVTEGALVGTQVVAARLNVIIPNGWLFLYVGGNNGVQYNFNGSSWGFSIGVGGAIYDIIIPPPEFRHGLLVSSSGIYRFIGTLLQAGDFRSICNIGGGVLYAGTFNGHVWKSIDNGITWSDHATITTVAIVSIIENNGRIIISDQYSSSTIWYTDDDFDTVIESTVMIGSNNRIIAVNDSVLLVANGTGDIWRSENNGESFSEILGNPQQGESSINDLILNYEYL